MKPLLKAADSRSQAGVQCLTDRAPPAQIAIAEPIAPSAEALHIAELEAKLRELQQQAGDAAETARRDEAEAYERGLSEGIKRTASGEEKRYEALADALRKAQDGLSDRLVQLDILALEVAQAALARIFGDETLYAGMVAATLRHHLAELTETMAIRARVSASDFPDETALEKLRAEHPGLALSRDSSLAPGACRLELRLGRVDAGISRQWECLSALIGELAEESIAA